MTPLPRYLQIAESLSREIGTGRLPAGDRLPSERELAADYKVTVVTLRKALAVLAERGLIDRKHGSGTYVTGQSDPSGAYALFRLERHPKGGGVPGADLLSLTMEEDATAFPDAQHIWRIRRLRWLDDVAVAVEDICLNGARAPVVFPGMLSESLYRSYRESFDLEIARATDHLSVAPLPDWAPDAFGNAPSAQFGLVERQAFDRYGTLAERSKTWFDPARARYVARVP